MISSSLNERTITAISIVLEKDLINPNLQQAFDATPMNAECLQINKWLTLAIIITIYLQHAAAISPPRSSDVNISLGFQNL